MKKIILGAVATLMISGSALANNTTSNSINTITTNEVKETLGVKRYCVVRVTTTYGDGSVKTQVYSFEVDNGSDPSLAQAQCSAIKASFDMALN